MIEFNDIDFYGHGPMPHHHHHEGHCGPQMPPPPPMPPFDPELKRVFDLAAHADRVAHKALDVAGFASLDAASAKKLAEQTLSVLNKVSAVADKANVKADRALSEIDLLKDDINTLINELTETQRGAGLATDGSYVQNESANYISEATSLADADNKLDAALKDASEKVNRLEQVVNNIATKINFIPNIIQAVGLNDNGTYRQSEGHSIISTATSVLEATENLEEAVKNCATKTELNSIRGGITQNSNDISIIKGKLGDLSRLGETETVIGDIKNIENTMNGLTGNISSLLDIVGNCPIPNVNNEEVPGSTLTCEFRDLVTKVKCNEDAVSELGTKLGNITIRKTSTDGSRTSYQLYVDGVAKGETIVVEQDSVVSRGSYDPSTKEIVLILNTGSEIRVPANGIFTPYNAGNGIIIDNNNRITADEYVAGPGLVRVDDENDPHEHEFGIKIESNSQDILHVIREDGLGINVDRLRELIGGGSEIDPADLAGKGLVVNNNKLDVNVGDGLHIDSADNKVKVSLGRGLTINNNGQIEIDESYLTNLINNLIDAKLLWQVKDGQLNAIEPKPQYTEVHVSGAIYSGQD